MVGPVDFEKDADYWQQDRWSGQFSVRWHIIKDVPNIRFRHILLESNDSKPVTHSRDSQEVAVNFIYIYIYVCMYVCICSDMPKHCLTECQLAHLLRNTMPWLMLLTTVQFCFLNKISSFPSFDGFVTSGPGLRKGQITISNRLSHLPSGNVEI